MRWRACAGGDVHGVQVDPKLRQDYMQLRIDGDRLAASIQQLLQPSVLAAKEEDAIILGLFLLLFHDRTKYTGVSDAPSSADVPRVSEQAAVAGVHGHPGWHRTPCDVYAGFGALRRRPGRRARVRRSRPGAEREAGHD